MNKEEFEKFAEFLEEMMDNSPYCCDDETCDWFRKNMDSLKEIFDKK